MSFDHFAWRPLPYSMGVPIGSDWQDKPADDPVFGLYTTCGFWSEGETDLLRSIAVQFSGSWLEIGAHTGWCTETLQTWDRHVIAIEPMFSNQEWYRRFVQNLRPDWSYANVMPWAGRSDQYFAIHGGKFDGCLIDGDHEAPHPLNDAIACYERLNERGVIILHDFRGGPVYDAAKYLVDQGMNWRVYPSVNMVFVAWRGEFSPPRDIQEGDTDWAKHYGLPEWAKK